MKYRKLPVVVDAWPARQLMAAYRQKFIGTQPGDFGDMPPEVGEAYLSGGWMFVGEHSPDKQVLAADYIQISTSWGTFNAGMNDYVVRNADGSFYPVRGEAFESSYEAAD